MSNVTCYGFKCSTVNTWEPSLRACCEPSGRSVNEFGQYFCAGNTLGQTITCFNQTYEAHKTQFDVYSMNCFDGTGNPLDAGIVSTSNRSAFGCSKVFLSNCYDTNGNHTEDPRNGTCDTGSSNNSSGASRAPRHGWTAKAVAALIIFSFATLA